MTNAKPSLTLGSFSFQPKFILAAILLLAFALRLARLTFQPLWWDEGYSLFFATRDLGTLLDRTALDIHPPLYYALLQLWTFFAGTNDFATRFFSVAIGVLTIPFIYALARRLTSPLIPLPSTSSGQALKREGNTALISGFLFAIAPIEIYYSQEVRMYGLVTLLCLASTYFFARSITAPTHATWVAYILVSAAALYTEYYAAFVIVFHAIVILSRATLAPHCVRCSAGENLISSTYNKTSLQTTRPFAYAQGDNRRPRFTFYFFFAWLATALIYLPWVIYAGGKLYNYVTFKVEHEAYPTQDSISFLAQHLAAFSVGHVSVFSWLSWASTLFIALAVFGVIKKFAPSFPRSPAPLLLLYLFIPLALGYLVNLRFPFHPVRYERLLLLASPAFFLLVAAGISAIKYRALTVMSLISLISFSSISLYDFYTVPRYPNDDYRPLIAQIQSQAQRGDNFLAIYPWQIGYLESYYHGATLNIIETPNDAWTNNPTQMKNELDELLTKNPRVWLPALQTLGRIVEDSLDAQLRPSNYSVLDTWFGTTRLELFQHAADPPRAARALRFDGSELSSWGVSVNAVVSGQDVVRVWFDWGDIAQKKLSLRLVDAKGNIWAQDDREIERGVQRIGLAIPIGTPPGAYDLRLALYQGNNFGVEAISIAAISVTSNDQPNLAAIPNRTKIEFGNGIQLDGYDVGAALAPHCVLCSAGVRESPLRPGFDSGITLYWQTTQKQNADYLIAIQLQDVFGKTWLDTSNPIARGVYGTSQWRGNELIRDPHTFTVPGDVPDGNYSLGIALIDPSTKNRVGNAVALTQVQVKGRPHYFGAPLPAQRSDARIGEIAKLTGYDLVRSGRNLKLVLYWQALGRGQIAHQIFVHVVDASGKIVAQKDQSPGAGEFPTTTWVKGEYIVDSYDFMLPNDASDFQIRVGMYDPGSGARLAVFDAAGNQTGDFVTIR